MLEKGLKSYTISNLLGMLHNAILSLSKATKELIDKNSEISIYDIRMLRDHITQRLNANEDIEDNEKLLKLLNLIATDREALELIKDETEDWSKLLEAIEESLVRRQEGLSKEEKMEIEDIIKLTRDVKGLIRASS